MSESPAGEKREVSRLGAVTIDGTPVAYVAIMAAIVAAFAFIPASVVIGGGGATWPAHDILHPLVGLLLGPVAGPIASIIGIFIGNALAPYTSLGPWAMLMGGMSAFAAGMVAQGGRSWLVPWLIAVVAHVLYFFQAEAEGIGAALWFSNTFTLTIIFILFAIPQVRSFVVDNLHDPETSKVKLFAAIFLVSWFAAAAGVQLLWNIGFATNPWPAEFWPTLVLIIFLERIVLPIIGALIGVGLFTALRRSSFVKPERAAY